MWVGDRIHSIRLAGRGVAVGACQGEHAVPEVREAVGMGSS